MAKNDLFINRKSELKNLSYGISNLQDYVLIAPRRYGKTSLVHRVLNNLRPNNDFIIIDIDLMTYSGGSVKSVAERIIEKCLNSIGLMGKLRLLLKQVGLSVSIKLKYQDLELEPLIQLFNLKDKDDEWKLLEEALQLPEKIAISKNKKVVVFYDEISEIYHHGKRIESVFRSVIQRHKNVSYLFAGSQESVMSQMFINPKAPFYRFGELMFLKPLTQEDVCTSIQGFFPTMPFDVFSEVVDITAYHPYYVSVVIKHFQQDSTYYASLDNFYNYINKVLIVQEYAYLEMQVLKLKDITHALDIIRIIAMNLNPYQELNLDRARLFRVVKWLETIGYIRINGRTDYSLVDPLLKYYLSQYEFTMM